MSKKETEGIPDAGEARTVEWTRLVGKGTSDLDKPRPWKEVASRARQQKKTTHVGIGFGICVQQNAELVNEFDKYECRYAFSGGSCARSGL